MSSDDPILNGQPISALKVVELRKELDTFGLSKTGNKKELFERLRDHLNDLKPSEAANEASGAATDTSQSSPASPRKGSGAKGSPAKAASPTKSPMNKYVAQYLQNQQATLEQSKRDAELVRAAESSSSTIADAVTTTATEPLSTTVTDETLITAKITPAESSTPSKDKAHVLSANEPVPLSSAVSPGVDELPTSKHDEASSAISNIGSDGPLQMTTDDLSTESENIAEMETKPTIETDVEMAEKLSPKITSKSRKASIPSKKEVENTRDTPETRLIPQSMECGVATEKLNAQSELLGTPCVVNEDFTKEMAEIEPAAETALELDYEEEPEHSSSKESGSPPPTNKTVTSEAKKVLSNEISQSSVKKEDDKPVNDAVPPAETPKKHRAIVYDLEDKPKHRSSGVGGDAIAPVSTKTTVSIQPVVTAKPLDQPTKYGVNSLGNVRARPLSPPRKEPTQYIHITHLKRPYVLIRLQAVLRTFGDFGDEDFWIDEFRSNCIVKYKSVEEAKKARDEMHNVKWPDVPEAPVLTVEFTTEEKLQRRRNDFTQKSEHKRSFGIVDQRSERSGIVIHVANDRKISNEKQLNDAASEKSNESRKRKASPPSRNNKSLDELFKKTKARPQIYYLPLTDEQIADSKKRRRR